jgi:hypothetical protein
MAVAERARGDTAERRSGRSYRSWHGDRRGLAALRAPVSRRMPARMPDDFPPKTIRSLQEVRHNSARILAPLEEHQATRAASEALVRPSSTRFFRLGERFALTPRVR